MNVLVPNIYYFCYRHNAPRGGQKHTYRHVDILNKNGFNAAAFHPGEPFRLTWFENDTKVISEAEFLQAVRPELDFVVLPEDLGLNILEFPGRKVIFNKSVFSGFQSLGFEPIAVYPYLSPEVVAAFTISDHNCDLLRMAYPNLAVEKVDLEIDDSVFQYHPLSAKKPLIACVAKSPEMLLPVYHILQSRAVGGLNHGQQFEWVFLEGCTEGQAANVLGSSLIFIFLGVAEGLGRMPLEAMACGSITVLYPYGPLKPLAIPPHFEYADINSMVLFVEEVMASYPDKLEQWKNRIDAGRRIASKYSMKNQEASVLDAWARVLKNASSLLK